MPMAAVTIEGLKFRIESGLVRTLSLWDYVLDDIRDPELICRKVRQQGLPADMLTFAQAIPDLAPRFKYAMEWDNIAALPITTHAAWLKSQVHPNTRNKINKANREGVVVKVEPFSRTLAEGLVGVFNETAIRRGKRYDYFGRDLQSVEKEWGTDLDRSDFLVAYCENEVVGFIKMVYGAACARTSGTVSKIAWRRKAPMNALFSKAVEVCAAKKIPYLVYGKFDYGKKGEDSLTEFKRNNGFQKVGIPRYFVPINTRGKIGLKLGLHHGLIDLIPHRLQRNLLNIRTSWYNFCCRKRG
jgi:hypothetical protein